MCSVKVSVVCSVSGTLIPFLSLLTIAEYAVSMRCTAIEVKQAWLFLDGVKQAF